MMIIMIIKNNKIINNNNRILKLLKIDLSKIQLENVNFILISLFFIL